MVALFSHFNAIFSSKTEGTEANMQLGFTELFSNVQRLVISLKSIYMYFLLPAKRTQMCNALHAILPGHSEGNRYAVYTLISIFLNFCKTSCYLNVLNTM